ncbi:MAG TPA: putative LPS assembly protein LptD [Ignavibacteriales bacterium]|nr:putative LPS assembly protein LptD [Ignavibacteriales bacterium]
MNKVTILFILLLSGILFSQERDTSLFITPKGPTADSLQIKSDTAVVRDTTKRKSDIDAVIYASGSDSLIFNIPGKNMQIFGSGELKYKKTELKSANITVDFNLNRIQASGVVDTSDTAKTKIKGTPVMSEAGEIYQGNRLTYDFKTQRGIISAAKSKAEGGFYGGSKVKKINKETYFIKNGTYTTCDADSAHYFFYASEMKVIMKEQIIAKWIWLYIGGVPLPIPLPFGVFPNETGRRSGLIAPAYGQSFEYGQYFSHLGYFWAINDYADVNLLSDIYLRGGYNLSSRIRYAKRYSLSGSIDGGFSNVHSGEKGDPDYSSRTEWRLGVYHNQQIDPTMRLDANLNFISSIGYLNRTSFNYNELLSQNIQSAATLSKTWEGTGNSMSVSYSRQQIINAPDTTQIGNINEVLPSVSFTMLPTYPFKKKGRVDPADEKWYEQIGINYSGQFQNVRNRLSGVSTSHAGFQHTISSNIAPKIGYFSVSPRFNYVERWYDKRIERTDYHVIDRARSKADSIVYKDSVETRDVNELNAVRSFDMGVEASTKLYGIIQPNALGIQALRHTITPRVSYTYTPDFSDPKWGYYGSYTDVAGKTVKYNKFEREVFGGPGAYEQQNLNFSVNNIFEMKTMKDPSDTTSEAKKIQLLNLDASLSYNFVAPTNKLSDLYLSYRTQVGELFSFNGSSSYSFYDFDYNKGQTSTRFLASRKGGGFMRLTNFQFSLSTSLSAERLKGKETKKDEEAVPSVTQSAYGNPNPYMGIYSDEPPDYNIPWDLALNFNYSMDKRDPRYISTYSNMSTSLNFSLTESIKIAFTGSYDFKQKAFTAPQVRIYKDLHCWEMNLSWNPLGLYRGYRFEIRVKAPQLQDIKVERSRGQFSGR